MPDAPNDRYPPNVRVSKRYVLGSAAALLTLTASGLGWFVVEVQRELAETRGTIDELQKLAGDQRDEIDGLKEHLVRVGDQLLSVRELEERARTELRARFQSELSKQSEGQRAGFKAKLGELEGQVQGLVKAAQTNAQLLAEARQDGDIDLRYRELMSPTVRVQSKTEVGSGTILLSRSVGAGKAMTYVLTAWHIVSETEGEEGEAPSDEELPLEVDFYAKGEPLRTELGKVVAKNEALDLALIQVRGYHVYETRARIPTRKALPAFKIFSKVYAIGCPLGYSPLPTSGELTSKDKELDGNHYWMINAPTIFGNSGGGIYIAQSRTMIGVLSRISAYKNMIDVAVPHMGLVTPMDQVYDWLDRTRYAFVYKERLKELAALTKAPKAAPAKKTALKASTPK